ncbi:MAG: D-alanine--D-alanine ligase [Anaerolineae bacterium]|nr:D-alanine--D-alanine ligase [Anaerolineae bacterium]
MNKRLRVGVIFGGRSGEHEVSLASARSVMAAMDKNKYEPVPIGITKEGQWLLSGEPMRTLEQAVGQRLQQVALAAQAFHARELVPVSSNTPSADGGRSAALASLDVAFPVLHGPFGEDGTVQGLLELAGIPYVGAGVVASAVGMDKAVMKDVFKAHGLPIVRHQVILRKAWEAGPARIVHEAEAAFAYPCFVKPACLGSSVGVTKAHDRAELEAGLAEAARYDRKIIIEEGVPHTREIECSVLGNDDPIASVPGEIVPSREFYDYAAKYLDNASRLLIPAPLSPGLAGRVRELAIAAFKAIDGAGMARVDFLLNGASGDLYLNEVNTIPGFTAISMYPKLWEASGISYPELIDRLIALALERHADRARSVATYLGQALGAQKQGEATC